MKKFKKVAIKTSRDELARVNNRVGKLTKVPGIISVHDLNLNPPIASFVSKVIPQIEKISSLNLPKTIKTALIGNLLDPSSFDLENRANTSLTHPPSPIFHPKRADTTKSKMYQFSTPKYQTPISKIEPTLAEEDDSLIRQLSHFYNSDRMVLDPERFPIPQSNINRVAEYIRSEQTDGRRGPIGTDAVAQHLAVRGKKIDKALAYIRNPNFVDRLNQHKRRLDAQEERDEKLTKRRKVRVEQKGAGTWQSLGIRY